MELGDYQLRSQAGAGQDGIAYRATHRRDGQIVEIRLLRGSRGDTDRWALLCRRLRTVALLDHPGAVRIRGLHLEHDPPFVVLDWIEAGSLAEAVRDRLPLSASETLQLAQEITAVLAAAHRLGLTHGRLSASSVLRTPSRPVLLDFTGTDVGTGPVAQPVDPADDVAALGAVLTWCLTGEQPSGDRSHTPTLPGPFGIPLAQLIQEMTAVEPVERPSSRQVQDRLRSLARSLDATGILSAPPTAVGPEDLKAALGETRVGAAEDAAAPTEQDELAGRERLGRYRLVRRLGQGGMGTVYQGEDPADGRAVAIKVLRSQLTRHPDALRRFHKEARLLAEVNNPYVTNLLEMNEDDGIHYLVLEFVAGRDLGDLLAERRRLDEAMALGIMADVCRGLAEAHQHGIVHRDVKPENILLTAASGGREPPGGEPAALAAGWGSRPPLAGQMVKLSDFGLARHIDESQSLHVTQAGTILGTPLYMAPEQGQGLPLDARADVYSLGATLFHLLAGRPPFVADSPLAVLALHANQPPAPLRSLNPDVSDPVSQLVEKCLAKAPDSRYPDASALLRDLERLLRGEATGAEAHPKLPVGDPHKLVRFDWTWELEASPEQLWPLVCNTERFNRAAGLPPVRWTTRTDPDGKVHRFGEFRKAGLSVSWEESPFEWIEGRRFGVLRQYQGGPFKWFVATVELVPRPGGGTVLTTHVRIEPHGFLGRTLAAVEVGINGKRASDRVYRRFDAVLTGKLGGEAALVDAFEDPVAMSGGRRRRLEKLLDQLGEAGIEPTVVERLGDFLATAPPQDVTRIRPFALARRLALDPDQVVTACLHGTRLGLLVLLWDILCPVCRIPSEIKDGLKALRDHGRCEACNLDFELDFANSVELIFRAHPEIRDADLGVYCIGGPAHSPHVAAQVRVGPREVFELELALSEGSYRLRGPQLPFALDFRVQHGSTAARWELRLPHGPERDLPRVLKVGRQTLTLINEHDRELVVRVERTAPRADALTASRASALALFRELFPGEVLSPGQLVSVATITLLVTGLEDSEGLYRELGDVRAFGVLHEYFRRTAERVKQHGGAVLKTVGEKLVAAFPGPMTAVQVALALPGLLAESDATRGLRLRVGVHRGPALAATLNDHLDYFGTTANLALRLPELGASGDVVLSQEVAADPQVAAFVRGQGLTAELMSTVLPGIGPLHRLRRG